MAHAGQEVGFGPVRRFGPLLGRDQLGLRPFSLGEVDSDGGDASVRELLFADIEPEAVPALQFERLAGCPVAGKALGEPCLLVDVVGREEAGVDGGADVIGE